MSSYVYVKNPNGKTYVYENTTYWDKETKTCKHKRVSVGHLDPDTGDIVANRKKGDAAKNKVKLQENKEHCIVTNIGVSLLLDKMADETGLKPLLQNVFADDWQQILTSAYYLVSEGGALCHVSEWIARNRAPYNGSLTSQRITELLTRITPSLQQEFFQKWIEVNKQDEYYVMDITSISSYSEFIEFVRWGYNRDGEELPQINLLMLTGEKSRLPIYYRIISGSIKDVSTLQESLENLELIKAGSLHYVMDKGFYSEKNIDAFYDRHLKYMVGVPFTVSFAKDAVERHRKDMCNHHNYCQVMDDELYAVTELMSWDNHRIYVHIYFDSYKAETDSKKFDHKLYVCYNELVSGNRNKANESFYAKYFILKETPVRGLKVEYNEEAISDHKKNRIGWFVLATNDIKDKVKALEIYRSKDAVEKNFDDLKNDLDMKRLRIHTQSTMDGRIFIQFIALILITKLKEVMRENNWFQNHNLQEVIEEMKSIREVSVEGKRKKLITQLTGFQSEIVELYKLVI